MPRFLAMMDAQWGVCVLSASTGFGRHRGGPLARLVERNAVAGFEFLDSIGSEHRSGNVTKTIREGGPAGRRAGGCYSDVAPMRSGISAKTVRFRD